MIESNNCFIYAHIHLFYVYCFLRYFYFINSINFLIIATTLDYSNKAVADAIGGSREDGRDRGIDARIVALIGVEDSIHRAADIQCGLFAFKKS